MNITLEKIKADQLKLAELIDAYEAQEQQRLAFPVTLEMPTLATGERYIGAIVDACGHGHHVILLSDELNKTDWPRAMAWAKEQGGDLPTRVEQALLYATAQDAFEEAAYWSNTQHAGNADCAWYQGFAYGYQHSSLKSASLRARAVRRLAI